MARKLKPLLPERLDELPSLCTGCLFWESDERLPPRCGSKCDAEKAAWWLRVVRDDWGPPGRVAVQDKEVLGFIKYAPPRYLPQARNFPAGPPSDDAVLIACLHIRQEARQHGLGTVLLQAALADLVQRGEKFVEAYAAAVPEDIDVMPVVSVDFLLRQGFVVHRPHGEFPLMRLELKSLATWSENLESVLESLRIPLLSRGPRRVPAPFMKPGR